MLAQDQIPPRVNALAKTFGDTVESYFERENGEVVIVFSNKGKHTFVPEPIAEPTFKPIIHTKQEAEEAVTRLPANPKRKEKKHGTSNSA